MNEWMYGWTLYETRLVGRARLGPWLRSDSEIEMETDVYTKYHSSHAPKAGKALTHAYAYAYTYCRPAPEISEWPKTGRRHLDPLWL